MPCFGILACRVQLSWIWPIADDHLTVSKSMLTILVIGIVGAVMMSLMMKHLVEINTDQNRSPYAAAVESRLAAKRLGPVRITQELDGEGVHLTVCAKVLAGLDKRALAADAGLEVWLGALRAGTKLDAVTVVLDDDDGEAIAFAIPAPTTRRPTAVSPLSGAKQKSAKLVGSSPPRSQDKVLPLGSPVGTPPKTHR